MLNLSIHGRRELSAGLQLQQRDHNHVAISHCCQACSRMATQGAVVPQLLNCKC